MSKELATEHEAQHEAGATEAASANRAYGLPPAVQGPVMQLGPGDADALRALLVRFPSLTEQILSAAVSEGHMGNRAIQHAIDLTRHGAVGRPGALTQAQIRPGGEFALEGDGPTVGRPGGLTQAQIRPGGEFALEGGPAARSAAAPAWVAGAYRYNEAHAALVDEFNELTDFVCTLDDDRNKLDPKEVAAWQRANHLDPDGKVGPHTLAAARANKARLPGVVAQRAQSHERPPV